MRFRDLKAKEIDCRIGQITKSKEGLPKGLTLLLYKDARVDMDILDETVGAENWQRTHTRDNANCIVSIWDDDKHQWISKEDTGVESYTEKEKGLASDSFKRACVNWGIGRELYTAPFIWIDADKCEWKDGKCNDNFIVTDIKIEDKQIVELTIFNEKTKKVVYEFKSGKRVIKEPKAEEPKQMTVEEAKNYTFSSGGKQYTLGNLTTENLEWLLEKTKNEEIKKAVTILLQQ